MEQVLKKVVPKKGCIEIHDGCRNYFFDVSSILYCVAQGNYTDFHLLVGEYPGVRGQLGFVTRKIAECSKFMDTRLERIGRSYIINLDYVRSVHTTKGIVVLEYNNVETKLNVPRPAAKRLLKMMQQKKEESVPEPVRTPQRSNDDVPMFERSDNESSKKWSDEEIEWCFGLLDDGYTYSDIAKSLGRSENSVAVKMSNLLKETNNYNDKHVEEKYKLNVKFADKILMGNSSRKSLGVLDLYCGHNNFWKTYSDGRPNYNISVTTNDENKKIAANYNEKSEKLVHMLYFMGNQYDIVDIDPFGSPYECIDLGVKMATRGLCITFGDLSMKRFRRLDFINDRYDIKSMDDFNIDALIEYVKKVGRRNGKDLDVMYSRQWKWVSRIWFVVK